MTHAGKFRIILIVETPDRGGVLKKLLTQDLRQFDLQIGTESGRTPLEADLLIWDLEHINGLADLCANTKDPTTPILLLCDQFDSYDFASLPKQVEALPRQATLVCRRVRALQDTSALKREQVENAKNLQLIQNRLNREISYHKETERILCENEATLRRIYRSIEATSEAIMITERSEIVYYINPAFTKLTGYEADEVFGSAADAFVDLTESVVGLAEMKDIAKSTGSWEGEVSLKRKDGSTYQAYFDLNAVKNLEGEFEGFIFIQRDISTLKQVMDELEQLARVDALTGLYNRRYFMESMDSELERTRRYKRNHCLLLVDLDFFKHVNDNHGHAAGDLVLKRAGSLIRKMIREMDFSGRYGGEELCICLPETEHTGGLAFAERLRIRLQEETFVDDQGRAFQVTCSIGVTMSNPVDPSRDAMFAMADKGLYLAKKRGRNRVETVLSGA